LLLLVSVLLSPLCRLSRADMGRIVASVRGYPSEHAMEVPSASVKRPVVRATRQYHPAVPSATGCLFVLQHQLHSLFSPLYPDGYGRVPASERHCTNLSPLGILGTSRLSHRVLPWVVIPLASLIYVGEPRGHQYGLVADSRGHGTVPHSL
jgi:hypothetical protein